MLKVRLVAASIGIAMMLLVSSTLVAQTENKAPDAPVPSQIFTAKKIFISNVGTPFDSNVWSGGSIRIYNEFYAAMKSWGRYELIAAPGEADLVLDVDVVPSSSSADWKFKLEILDPKTRIVLWTQYEPMKITPLQKSRDKNFDETIGKLVVDLKKLTAQPADVKAPQ